MKLCCANYGMDSTTDALAHWAGSQMTPCRISSSTHSWLCISHARQKTMCMYTIVVLSAWGSSAHLSLGVQFLHNMCAQVWQCHGVTLQAAARLAGDWTALHSEGPFVALAQVCLWSGQPTMCCLSEPAAPLPSPPSRSATCAAEFVSGLWL